MDNKFMSFYNQNRKLFWIIVLTIIGIIILIHVLNNYIKINNLKEDNAHISETNTTKQTEKNYSVISKKQLDDQMGQIIIKFIDYCNSGEINSAYELLSDDCKQILFPSIESFLNNYYNRIFQKEQTYSYQAMINNGNYYTYQVNFTEDILASGKKSGTSIVDYYTIVNEKGEKKLNINKFIRKKALNSNCEAQGLEAEIEYKLVYFDYEIYSASFKNKDYTKVILDDFTSPRNVFLEDEKGNRYIWTNYEYVEEEMVLNKGIEKKLFIKFNKEYKPTMEAKTIVFQKVIIDNKEKASFKIDIL